jgi:putative FmdB family regulatory protein
MLRPLTDAFPRLRFGVFLFVFGGPVPLFEFRCSACAHVEEVLQKHGDPPPNPCPKCGKKKTMSKEMSLTSFQLKGGGWYKDLYSSSNKSESSSSDSAESSSKTETKADSTSTETKAVAPETKSSSSESVSEARPSKAKADKPKKTKPTPAAA